MVAVGWNSEGQLNVTGWTDVVRVSAIGLQTAAIRANGTAVAVGWDGYGQCSVSGWTDVRLFER